MLTKKQKQKWIDELNDPKNRQCRRATWNNDGSRCCLTLFVEKVLGLQIPVRDHSRAHGSDVLEDEVRSKFIHYNDQDELTFPEIAFKVAELPTSD